MSKLKLIIIYTLVCFAVCSKGILAQQNSQTNTSLQKLTVEEWREDLQYFAIQMPKIHKNVYHSITKEEFNSAINRLNEKIPSLTWYQIVVEFSRLSAMIGDGHTELWMGQDVIGFHQYPLRVYLFDDDLYLQSVEARYADYTGTQIVKIGKYSADEVFKKVSEILARDNEMYLKAYTPRYLIVPEVLRALGIIDDMNKGEYTVEDRNGKLTTLVFKPQKTNDDLNSWSIEAPRKAFSNKFINAREFDENTPLYLQDPQNYFWYKYLPEAKILYISLTTIRNKSDETIKHFVDRVFETAKEKDVEKLVLDIRQNGGGNNQLNEPWLQNIIKHDNINQYGKFFIVIDRHTFSAASHLVTLLEQHTKAIFVGEPTGASPNHYGDTDPFHLPNSKIEVEASALFWQNSLPWDNRRWTPPQIYTPLTFHDYINNIDPAMQAIINYEPGQSFKQIVSEFEKNNNVDEFIKKYKAYKSNQTHIYVNTENELNILGYRLMGKNLLDDAIEIFKLNVESYPESWNVYDSLGEAYMKKGNREQAIKNYKKVLEINPNSQSAAEALRKLKNK